MSFRDVLCYFIQSARFCQALYVNHGNYFFLPDSRRIPAVFCQICLSFSLLFFSAFLGLFSVLLSFLSRSDHTASVMKMSCLNAERNSPHLSSLLTNFNCSDKIQYWILLEWYRSGHNEAVLKTVCPTGRMGSNPIHSAEKEQACACSFFLPVPLRSFFGSFCLSCQGQLMVTTLPRRSSFPEYTPALAPHSLSFPS